LQNSLPRNYFFVGPSGIGKSTIVREIARRRNDCKAVSLDDLTLKAGINLGLVPGDSRSAYDLLKSVGNDTFFMVGLTALYRMIGARDSSRKLLVDIGAAFQNVTLLSTLSRFEMVICLYASPEASFERYASHRKSSRTYEKHVEIEFSGKRSIIYESAEFCLDTSNMSLEETIRETDKLIE